MRDDSGTNIFRPVTLITLIMLISVMLFEVIKHWLSNDFTDWVSHAETVVFCTVLTGIASTIVLRRYKKLAIKFHQELLERKQIEQSLSYNESSLAQVQRIARLGHWELDIVNNVLTWSDEVYRIFGVEPQTFGATRDAFSSYVHPEDLPKVDQAAADAFDKIRPFDVEHRIVRDDGKIGVVHELAEIFYDDANNPIRMVGTVHDITESKRDEEALRENEERLKLAWEQSPLGALEWDLDFRATRWNAAAEKIFGYTKEEALGQNGNELIVPENEKIRVEEVKELLKKTNRWIQEHKRECDKRWQDNYL
jgi:PAS domain S-box-containing protein